MNREVSRILAGVRALLLFLNRLIETILRRLKEAQDRVTDTVRDTLPERAQVKLAVMQRVAAKAIDMVIVVLVAAFFWYPIGPFLGFFYSLLGDGFSRLGFQGQSVGKRLMGLRVVRVDGAAVHWRESILRNLPVGVATFFAIIPLWGWVIFVLIGIPLAGMEIFLMFRLEGETRLGDVMADTRVLELRPRQRFPKSQG
ncbi:MAG: hypothetical protein RJB38_1836 [Pseudomonadota bacterium]|jgi:uncharacterized RDD family membrane protein YckC